ncbi:hypothetical protein DICVIV_03169 [Dictyocaulus viviparus]|uniref:Uncharacterized protein n=1 Tax=Dictyocaulus viviparus TaxID=29172 RepID=A0A0D8Y3P6_DICVI|nr:hypothetical protein DICVIV_03169 [Dictyocaulus viviparus]
MVTRLTYFNGLFLFTLNSKCSTIQGKTRNMRHPTGNDSVSNKYSVYIFIMSMLLPTVLFFLLVLLYICCKRHPEKVVRRSRRTRAREIESVELHQEFFKDKGVLVMQSSFAGPVKHALQDVKSVSIKRVTYDDAQNSIIGIGTDIEKLEGRSYSTQMTQLSDDVQTCRDVSPTFMKNLEKNTMDSRISERK